MLRFVGDVVDMRERNDSAWDNDTEDVRRKCSVGFDEPIIRDV